MGAILVIADDLTGAAELGGIAIRLGIQSKISHHLDDLESEGVQIINTNTRSLRSADILCYLQSLFPEKMDISVWELVFLKFDSAMRGEIGIQLEFFKNLFLARQLVFCPVNPSLGRIIRNEKYYIGAKEIAHSEFAHDPEFPVVQSAIKRLINVPGISLISETSEINVKMTYIVPSIANNQEIERWADQLPNFKLFAGAGAFFERLLVRYLSFKDPVPTKRIVFGRPLLYVCGSKHDDSTQRINRIPRDQVLQWCGPGEERELAIKLTEIINRHGIAVFSVQPQKYYEALTIRESMALTVNLLQEQCHIRELVIEGGATAHAVLKQLNIDVLRPTEELSPGVTRSEIADRKQMVTMKPGSYPWSKELWGF